MVAAAAGAVRDAGRVSSRRVGVRLRARAASRERGFIVEFGADRTAFDGRRAAQVYDSEESKWVGWMSTIDEYKVDSKLSFAELIVPTPDSVRSTFILAKLLANRYHCMMVGETGTGKTVNISQYLQGVSKCEGRSAPAELMPLTMTFSAQTCGRSVPT